MEGGTENDQEQLDPARLIETVERLSNRIRERFPDANLIRACKELNRLSTEAGARAIWIGRPIATLRVGATLVIALVAVAVIVAFSRVDFSTNTLDVVQFVSLMNTTMNNIVLFAAAIFFLVTIETRVKRRRALLAIHELRSLAHVIDMYQLTKDPDRILFRGGDTKSSPGNDFGVFEMSRYLDYCAEMLSLIAKIAAMYGVHWTDEIAIRAINDVERLTASLSQKIFQKTMILHGTLNVTRLPRFIGQPCDTASTIAV